MIYLCLELMATINRHKYTKNMDRSELKRYLPHGSLLEIAKKAGVSGQLVGLWFAGKCENAKVKIAVYELALKYKKQIDKLEKELFSL